MGGGAATTFNNDVAYAGAAATANDYDDAVMVIGEWRGVMAGASIFRGVSISGPTQCAMVENLARLRLTQVQDRNVVHPGF